MDKVRTRIAPSPTGKLHLGTAYAALWPYLYARKNNGQFILRIEDTDTSRSTQEFAENIINSLKWLGYEWDEGPYFQTQRLSIYQQAAQKLLAEGRAYRCFCAKEEIDRERVEQVKKHQVQVYSGRCRNLSKEEVERNLADGKPYVIRYRLPEDRGVIVLEDMIHGRIEFNSSLLGDMIIVRQDGTPLYNFAVVVDDADMDITHVLRGDDHISNTPKQILLFEALGKTPPHYGHYPMILNQDRSGKLSKRTGSTSVEDYKNAGYLPEALINYLALLGWTPPNQVEVLSLDQIIRLFDIRDMNIAAAAWNQDKLDWLNSEYIRKMPDQKLTNTLIDYLSARGKLPPRLTEERVARLTPLVKERIKTLSDFVPLTSFIFEQPEYDKKVFGQLKVDNLAGILKQVGERLGSLKKPWQKQEFEQNFQGLAKELGLSNTQMFQLIRVAVSGRLVTPPLFESMVILGEEEVIRRIQEATDFLST